MGRDDDATASPARRDSSFCSPAFRRIVEYYVDAGPVQTPHFHLRVADIPAVKQIRVTYHHPDWMHLGDTVEEHGGDLRAVEGHRGAARNRH